jgi:hypothetical protein
LKLANLIRLHVAAFHFAKTPECTAQELAHAADVKIKTIYRWVQRPEWHAALDALHFTGDRAFGRNPTRDTRRDAGGLVEEAFEIYKVARKDGHPPKKAVTAVVNKTELKRRRVNTWAERYDWEATLKTD